MDLERSASMAQQRRCAGCLPGSPNMLETFKVCEAAEALRRTLFVPQHLFVIKRFFETPLRPPTLCATFFG